MNHISISLSLASLMVLIFKCYIIKKIAVVRAAAAEVVVVVVIVTLASVSG